MGEVFAARLKLAQGESGLKNEALARKSGVSLRLIQLYRKGETVPRDENLAKLATALGRDPMWFFSLDAEAAA